MSTPIVLWRKAIFLAATLPLLAGAAPATASTVNPESGTTARLQSALDRLVADGVRGVLALRRNGYQVWRATSGVSDVHSGVAMRAGDRFRVGSITKTFVSTVILQLVAEQRLRLTDSVQRWLPGIAPNDSAITVRQLLNHTSGPFDYTEDPRLLAPYGTDSGYFWLREAVKERQLNVPGTGV